MARTKSSRKNRDPILDAKAAKTIENLRGHYERGRRGRAEFTDISAQNLAEKYGVNVNTFRKERKFAELYSKDDLEELLRLRRPDGMPLQWGHVVYLITLQPKTVRREYQKRAAKNGWTATELWGAIRAYRPPNAARGGRPIKVPTGAQAARRLLFQETERWLQRFKAVAAKHADLFDAAGNANGELLQSLEDRLEKYRDRLASLTCSRMSAASIPVLARHGETSRCRLTGELANISDNSEAKRRKWRESDRR